MIKKEEYIIPTVDSFSISIDNSILGASNEQITPIEGGSQGED